MKSYLEIEKLFGENRITPTMESEACFSILIKNKNHNEVINEIMEDLSKVWNKGLYFDADPEYEYINEDDVEIVGYNFYINFIYEDITLEKSNEIVSFRKNIENKYNLN